MKQKRVVAIHDISCVGRCSLTVALPVLSAAGLETSVLPTAVLSTHTGDFTGYTYRNLSEDIPAIAAHWKTLGLHTDAFYTGYLASEEQVDTVRALIRDLRDADSLVMVDPVMGDNGRLYDKFSPSFPDRMRRLCEDADLLIPNRTEAYLLLGEDPQKACREEPETEVLLHRLAALGPSRVILTGVSPDPSHLGAVLYDSRTGETVSAFSNRADGFYYGTGDLLASALLGAILRGMSDADALRLAVRFTSESIRRTAEEGRDRRYGVNFEQGLGDYIAGLNEKQS